MWHDHILIRFYHVLFTQKLLEQCSPKIITVILAAVRSGGNFYLFLFTIVYF